MIIDFHTHCFPDALAPRAMAVLEANAGVKAPLDGTVASLVASMKRAGVDRSVMLQIATKPSQNRTVNTWAIERREPELIPFGSIHPDGTDWADELKRLAAAGIKGVKLHPEYQGFYVDDARMFPIYRLIDELGLIVLFHAGADIGVPPPVHGAPEHFARVLDRLPHGRAILAHLGGWKRWDGVEKLLVGTHLVFDTSFSRQFMPFDQMKRLVERHGADKFVMGSDSPWDDPQAAIDAVRELGVSPDEESAILGGNAARLLGLGCAATGSPHTKEPRFRVQS
ncbi:MAG: amidohydrolase family protein [Kiritimatiellia bacterium]|jgi:predicted TIM-barrel fold metal-dependent hydrolase